MKGGFLMLNKKHLILFILAAVILTACNKNEVPRVANQGTTAPTQPERTEVKEKPTDTNSAEIKNSNPTNDLQKDNITNDINKVNSQGEQYNNEKLGFSFVVPESWRGKYLVKQEQNGILVFYKPIDLATEGKGLLFAILKRTSLEDEHSFDNVGEPRTFEVNGITYITGGPTDVGFPEGHKEFADFIKLKKEVREVVKTIKPIG